MRVRREKPAKCPGLDFLVPGRRRRIVAEPAMTAPNALKCDHGRLRMHPLNLTVRPAALRAHQAHRIGSFVWHRPSPPFVSALSGGRSPVPACAEGSTLECQRRPDRETQEIQPEPTPRRRVHLYLPEIHRGSPGQPLSDRHLTVISTTAAASRMLHRSTR